MVDAVLAMRPSMMWRIASRRRAADRGDSIGRLIGFIAAVLLALAALGQPVLAGVVAPQNVCCSVAPAGASGPGRSIAPQCVDDALTGPQTVRKPVTGPNGEARVSHLSGTVEVITEGDTVFMQSASVDNAGRLVC